MRENVGKKKKNEGKWEKKKEGGNDKIMKGKEDKG